MKAPYINRLPLIVILVLLGSTLGREHGHSHHQRGHQNKVTSIPSTTTEQIPTIMNAWQSDEDGGYMSSQDICDSWYCGLGQECRPGSDSLPTCVCKEECPPVQRLTEQKKSTLPSSDGDGEKHPPPEWNSKDFSSQEQDQGPVCGTDGIVYPSECELERSGCLTANPTLQVVGGPELCREEENEEKTDNEENEKGNGQEPEMIHPVSRHESGNDGNKNNRPGKESKPRGTGSRNSGNVPPREPRRNDDEMDPEKEEEEEEENDDDKNDYPQEGEQDFNLETDYSSLKKMKKSIKKMRLKSGGASKMGKKHPAPASSTSLPKRKRGSTLCTLTEYKIFKEALLNYNLKHLLPIQPHPVEESKTGRWDWRMEDEKLISEMFGHFDQNHDGILDYAELQQIGFEESLGRPMDRCHSVELLHHDDANGDGRLDPVEFEAAFTTSTGGAGQSTRRGKVIRVKGKVGERMEIKCPLSSQSPSSGLVEWSRFGRPMDGSSSLAARREGIMIGEVGKGYPLSIPSLELAHAGNFSCTRRREGEEEDEEFSFQVTVNSEPIVKVSPHMVLERPGAGVRLECRVHGEPLPSIRWLKNEAPLSPLLLEKGKYAISGPFLDVNNVGVSDTGAYLCEGSNTMGSRVDIASLLVVDEYISLPSDVKTGGRNESLFVLLHAGGISMYNPNNCRLHQEILGSDIIPGTQQDLVCDSHPCSWGSGVLVPSSYIYAAQPSLNRILVISLSEMVVVDVIPTIQSPILLHHVPHTDQVWIHGEGGVQVVQDSKKKKKHGSAKSIDDEDKIGFIIRSMFLPSAAAHFSAGYLTKHGVRGMYKIDLKSGKYLKSVDLSGFNCLPEDVHFSGLYGFLILECREPVLGRPTGTLLLDSITEAVVGHHPQLQGRSFLSPDDRWLITLTPKRTKKHKEVTDVVVHKVTRNGLEHQYTVRSSINASNLAFFPSQTVQSYDIFATSSNTKAHSSSHHEEHLIFIDLTSGRTELVPGVERSSLNPLLIHDRAITAQSGEFGHFLVTPGSRSAFVVNGRTRTVNCQVGGAPLNNISSILWL